MKSKIKTHIVSFFILFLCVSFADPYSVKRISDQDFRYEFYTTKKSISPKLYKTYYWFKGGLIHNAQSGVSGELLNDKFVKTYHSNQLAEQGAFRNGLKKGLWKTWYNNGVLESTQRWSSGVRSGMYNKFDEYGNLIVKGSYTNDLKFGKWIDFIKKDTTIYNKNLIVLKNKKFSKSENLKPKSSNIKNQNQDVNYENNIQSEKPNFFKRLFSKKQK